MQRFLPLLAMIALFGMFYMLMTDDTRNPQEIKSVMIGRTIPDFVLPALDSAEEPLYSDYFKRGEPLMINFFARWCVPCRAEHESLMKLAKKHHIRIIGIAYKDSREASLTFLDELGDPYLITAADENGRVAIDFGVTGVPETFVIDGKGVIRYRHWGPVVGDGLEAKLLPAWEAVQ
jgi:cytochrome c biogenesis protein CcmG/thiol:disulfide interchange protein DsbE